MVAIEDADAERAQDEQRDGRKEDADERDREEPRFTFETRRDGADCARIEIDRCAISQSLGEQRPFLRYRRDYRLDCRARGESLDGSAVQRG